MSTSDPDSPVAVNRGWTWERITFWLIATLIIVGLIALLLPPVTRSRIPARRMQCKNNFKQLGLALHNYHDAYGSFPPAYTVDAEGKPLHSWRALILPYLDQQALYGTIDLSMAWDDPVNALAAQAVIPQYACPSASVSMSHTPYVVVVGAQTCFPGAQPRKLSEIADGENSTLMAVEVPADHAVPWMSPRDADAALFLSINDKSKTQHTGGLHVAFVDGSVRWLPNDLATEIRAALITVDGGETVELGY